MKTKFILSLFLLTIQITFSQIKNTTSVKGTVVEESSGKVIPGANIIIKELKKATISDADGNFIFRDIPIGKYEIQFATVGFDTKIVTDIDVTSNETTSLNISLLEKKNLLDEIVITRTRAKTESIKSLLALQKSSIRVSDGISAESIKRTPDRTTSDVLKRISGASIQDNKFVIIRGLNDRYNTTFLNGSPLPSSEPDRKAFSFDIFPANMIDNLVIYKTASPDLPGEFAGGVIEINTKSVPDKDFQSLSIGGGYNTITTGKNQIYATGGSTDWLGIDNSRSFPKGFPNSDEFLNLQNNKTQSSLTRIDQATKSYVTDWSLYNKNFLPNINFQYSTGRHIKGKDGSDFGFLISVSNSITNNYNQTTRKTYETPTVLEQSLVDDRYSTQTLFGAIANLSLKLNSNNSFNFKNLYSINSDNRVIERSGQLDQQLEPLFQQTSARLFTSNTIYTNQLNGEHFLPEAKLKISWTAGYSTVVRNTPNDRRNTYVYLRNFDGTFTKPTASFQVNTTGGDSPGSFFSMENKEVITSSKIDVSRKLKFSDKIGVDFKIGFFNQNRDRKFSSRTLGYTPFNGLYNGSNYNQSTFDTNSAIRTSPNETIFNPQNFGVFSTKKSGLVLFEGTRPNDQYTAFSKLNAAYLMLDNSFGPFRLIWGVRVEDYSQYLDAKKDNGQPLAIDIKQTDFLPSANLIIGLNKKQNLRLSYSKTLNRPEFRELAPFLFYNPETRRNTQGTDDLKIAKIENFDFRYEIFPGKGQLFSLSAFFKKFQNPIELQALANNSDKYQNALSAENKGLELEYRTLVSSIFGTKEIKILDDITFFTNIAIIRSKVDISNISNNNDQPEIPLQGQSPYVFNAGLQYLNIENGWSTALNINRIGDRIAIQANQTQGAEVPALWEKSRTFLDMQIAKSFMKNKFELKLNVQNVLAEDQIFYYKNYTTTDQKSGFDALLNNVFTGNKQNPNGYDSNKDDEIWLTKFGRVFSFTATYNF